MEYTIGLVILDFVPVFAFLVAAFFLVKITLLTRGKPCGRMMMAGTLLVFTGGFLKVIWKLLYTLNIANLKIMSELQFILLAFGFFAMLVSIILITQKEKGNAHPGNTVIAMAAWKIPFLAVMTICSLGAQGILTYISFQKKARLAAAMFILAVLCMLGMSGMASSVEQTITMQWVEESINTTGQIALAIGSYLLYRVFKQEKVAIKVNGD